jgi:hypothetical protein
MMENAALPDTPVGIVFHLVHHLISPIVFMPFWTLEFPDHWLRRRGHIF